MPAAKEDLKTGFWIVIGIALALFVIGLVMGFFKR